MKRSHDEPMCGGVGAESESGVAAVRALNEFLESFKVARGSEHSHTSLDPPGRYYVSADSQDRFHALYVRAASARTEAGGALVSLTEKHRATTPICIDMDVRLAEANRGQRVYDDAAVDEFLKSYTVHLNDYVKLEGAAVRYYVLEKPPPASDSLKDGLHVMAPHVVTRPAVLHMIRDEMVLEDDFRELCASMGCVNDPSDVFDKAAISRNNWLMYGSSKKSGAPPYVATRVVDVSIETNEIVRNAPPSAELPELVRLLSIRNKFEEAPVREKWEAYVTEVERHEAKLKADRERAAERERVAAAAPALAQKGGGGGASAEAVCTDVDLAKRLVGILNPSRSDAYQEWMALGWCLFNIDRKSLLDCWVLFSRQSSKFVEGECERLWAGMRGGSMGMGTLRKWAREDSPNEYEDVVRTSIRELIYGSLSATHYDVALVTHAVFRGRFVCASIKNRAWYEFRGHRWVPCDNGYMLRRSLSTTIWNYFMNTVSEVEARKAAAPESDRDMYEKMGRQMMQLAVKLRTSSFKDNVMRECAELFYEEGFEEKLDSRVELIGFDNGVFDLDAFEFREGRPEDFLSFSTRVAYTPFDPSSARVAQINAYMEQVLVDEAVRSYVWRLFASFLHGGVREQKFHIWTGSGSNSKSKLVELFEKAFGDYCCKFPVTLLTQKRVASNAANTEVAKAKGKRFATLQEPSDDEKINIGLMKELSGGDRIMARALYKEPIEFSPQFKMLLLCNQLPHVPSEDGGTWRRIRVVEFTSKFVENPSEENEFPMDVNLSARLEQWKETFMSMLIEEYRRYAAEGISEPAAVTRCTNDYKKANDHMADFVDMTLESSKPDTGDGGPREGEMISVGDVMAELRQYLQTYAITSFKPVRATVESYICRAFKTTMFVRDGHRHFRNVRMRQAQSDAQQP